jgi:FkbM family methyltransferase
MKSSRLQNYTIYYENSEEYHRLKNEIFTSDLYYFETNNPTLFIIDAGAHIGLATLYFKKIYPGAEIIAIEPNPESFEILENNLYENQINNITTVHAALSDKVGNEKFYLDSTDEKWHSSASFHKGSWIGSQKSREITVSTHLLSEFVTKPVDFLKLDIEASEQKVLFASKEILPLIKEMHIEFHTHASQSLSKTIELLEKTHEVELYKDMQIIPLKKAKGLVQIRAVRK